MPGKYSQITCTAFTVLIPLMDRHMDMFPHMCSRHKGLPWNGSPFCVSMRKNSGSYLKMNATLYLKKKKFKLISKHFSQASLTWILGEKSTTFAVDYLFDDSHFCWRWGWHQPQAWHHWVDGGDPSHHVEAWIEAWHTD